VASFLLLASVVPLLRGFVNPTVIKFQKELRFGKEFRYRFWVFFAEAVTSVSLVLITHSVAALVWGMITGAFFEVVLSFLWSKPTPTFSFSGKYLCNLVSRGKWVTLAGIFNYFFSQGDNITVGRLLNTQSLGLYQMAYKISILPITEISDVVSKVTFPVYIKISGDLSRLKNAFRKTFLGTLLLVIPSSLVFFFFPREIVSLILGEKWISVAPVLRVLALFVPLRAFSSTAVTLFFSLQKQRYVTRISFFSFLFLAATIVPLTHKLGIVGTGISVVISSVLVTPLIIYYLWKVFKQK
ncbi:MAG: oligosaccharide flippase family protein, partial [Microgenomates group bacterium]